MWSSRKRLEPGRTVTAALRFAARRVRSEQELIAWLRRQGASPAVIREAVAACRTRGVVDDRAAARLWADTWARQGYSAAAITARLADKGFEDALAGRVVRAADDPERARAVAAAGRRSGPAAERRMRAGRRLAARGFDPDMIADVLDETFGPSSD